MTMRANLDMDALRSFVLGLELGSFSKAAERVGRSASAVSEQMARLEAQAGKPLLRKQGRGLVPTDAGETMLGYARRLLELDDEAVRETVHGAYRIIYRVTTDRDRGFILRFWHGARGTPQIVED